jgi:hypothetical protein
MKRYKILSVFLLLSITSALSNNICAQNCECVLCRVSCSSPASAHTNPLCPVYKNRMANSDSNTGSSGLNMEQEIMGMIFQSIIKSVLSPSNNTAKSVQEKEKLEREDLQRKHQLAIQQMRLKKYNDSTAQANHDKMMKDYKKLDGSGDISYKGLDDEKKWVASVKFNCKIISFKGEVRIVKYDGTIKKLSKDQPMDLASGDWIYTGKNSTLKLHYNFENGGKDIIIGQNSFLNIVTNDEGTQVPKLVDGNTYVTNSIIDDVSSMTQEELISMGNEIKRQQAMWKRKFEIRTPTAICGIRGTTFSVSQDSLRGTILVVREGIVDLTGLLIGQKVVIEAGYKGIVTLSGEILGPIKIEESEINKWWEMN